MSNEPGLAARHRPPDPRPGGADHPVLAARRARPALLTPSLDEVAGKHSVPMTPQDAPAFKDMMNIGHKFQEFDTDSSAMVVLEGDDKLGDSAHEFYNKIVAKLKAEQACPVPSGLLE